MMKTDHNSIAPRCVVRRAHVLLTINIHPRTHPIAVVAGVLIIMMIFQEENLKFFVIKFNLFQSPTTFS